ncbi:hypothetical protein IL306_006119 [Fusarium sp. DS 682]|nr:hypothetical protein IL306_006119 [Fusarium sp. DS 682]
MRKMVYRHFALQVIRYTCSHVIVDYELDDELRLAREGYRGLSFDIIHKLTGEPPYLSYSHKGPHDQGYAYHDRVHGLFDWDDGLPPPKISGRLNPTRPFISGLHQWKMGVDDTEYDREDRWLLGGSYHLAGIPDSLMMDENTDLEIGGESEVAEASEAFTINFGSSIPFTEIPSCIEEGMELIRDLYATNRPRVLAHYENSRACLEQALGDPLCDLLLMIVLTFTSSTVTPALPPYRTSFEGGPKRDPRLLAITLMTKMLWFLYPQYFPWQDDDDKMLGIPGMTKQMGEITR